MKKILILILISISLISCQDETFKIGFAGDLSSKTSQLAIDARNSLILGVKLINEDGGVNGQKLELIVKDDKSNHETALRIHEEFKSEEVNVVIGHLVSSMSNSIKQSADEDLLFISPSIGTDDMSNLDDYFIRSAPINSSQAVALNDYFFETGVNELVVVYDLMNAEYTENLYDALEEIYVDSAHKITGVIAYNSTEDPILEVAKEIATLDISNILFISQATDTAFFQQYLIGNGHEHNAYSVSWSMTADIFEKGGSAVEGMIFIGMYAPESNSPEYVEFANLYKEEYGYLPSFISVLTYDAFNILVDGLREVDDMTASSIKKAIIEISDFKGLQEKFSLNKYGDNNRKYMLYEIIGDEFVPIR